MDIENYLIKPYIINSGKSLPPSRKKNHMSFKEWSAAQNAPDKKTKPDDKPAADQPKTQPANTPAEVVSPPKS